MGGGGIVGLNKVGGCVTARRAGLHKLAKVSNSSTTCASMQPTSGGKFVSIFGSSAIRHPKSRLRFVKEIRSGCR